MGPKRKGRKKSPLADRTCVVCAKEHRCRSELIRHARVHTREKPYKCETCCASFSWKSSLDYHRKVQHTTGTAKQVCAICAKVFKDIYSLKRHMKGVHKDVPTVARDETAPSVLDVRKMVSKRKGSGKSQILPDHACAICGRQCAQPSKLIEHIRVHTGERPYKCDTCGVCFAANSNLRKHQLVLHSRKQVAGRTCAASAACAEVFKCVKCRICCRHKSALHSHVMNKHNTVVKTRSPGISHHTKSQPADKSHSRTLQSPEIRLTRVLRSTEFACRICKETFTSRDHLVAHSETHSFDHLKCVVCGKYFSNRFDLNCHLQMCAHTLDC